MIKIFRNIFLFCLSILILSLFNSKTHAQVIDTEMYLDTSFNFDISSYLESTIENYSEYENIDYGIGGTIEDLNNKIIVSGYYYASDDDYLYDSQGESFLLRLNNDGSIDETFFFDSLSYIESNPIFNEYEIFYFDFDKLSIDLNNKIVVGGSYIAYDDNEIYETLEDSFLIRLNNDGSIDETFSFNAISFLQTEIDNYNEYEDVGYHISTITIDHLNNQILLSGYYWANDNDSIYENLEISFLIVLNNNGGIENTYHSLIYEYFCDTYSICESVYLYINSVIIDKNSDILVSIEGQYGDGYEESRGLRLDRDTESIVEFLTSSVLSTVIEDFEDYENIIFTYLSLIQDENSDIYIQGEFQAEDYEDERLESGSFFVKLDSISFYQEVAENIILNFYTESEFKIVFQNDGKMLIIIFSEGNNIYVDGWVVPKLFRISNDNSVSNSDITGPILDFPQTNGTVYAMALSEDESILYMGGDFTEVDGVARNYLAAINTSTYAVTDWNPNPDGIIHAIDVYGNYIFIGGEFHNINSVYTGEFAKINSNGLLEELCDPNIHQFYIGPTTVYAIKATEEYIYVGGSFAAIGTYSDEREVSGLVRLENTNSCTWDEVWTPTIQELSDGSPIVYSIDIDGDDIFIGGAIAGINGTETGEFAKIDQEGELDDSCMPDIHTYIGTATVYSIKIDSEYIYVGGSFDRIGSGEEEEIVQGLIRLNKNDCSRDLSWNPNLTGGYSIEYDDFRPTIYTISVWNDSVFIGGSLAAIDNQVTEFGRLSKSTATVDSNWNPNITTWVEVQTVYSSLVINDYIYIGGSFNHVGEEEVLGLTAFNLDTRPPTGSITINLGKAFTNTTSVTLSLNASDVLSDVDEMIICNNNSFSDCAWESYKPTKLWILSMSSGEKTVYVKFKDSVGNISEIYSDSIILHTPSVRITDIGLVTGLADKSSLTVYFTSTSPLVKGVTQAGSSVYFVYDGNTYSTVADSNGNFSISLDVSLGTNTITYYSKDISDNQSLTKTLNLIVGTQYFPESLLISMGLMTTTEEQESDIEQEETPEIPEEESEQEEEQPEQEESSIQTLQFTDKDGNPLVNAFVEIEGVEYFTDSNGEIRVMGLEDGKKYKVKVEIDGVKYTSEVLGTRGVDGSIQVQITEGDIANGIEWKRILIYGGGTLLFILFLIIIFRRKK